MPATFVVFDVIPIDAGEHTELPLLERKERPQSPLDPYSVMVPTMYVVMGQGKALHALAKKRS